MTPTIQLSQQEATLRLLLLDVSSYIGSLEGYTRPQLRFTGGWVRDKLLGIGSNDRFKFGTLMNQYVLQPEAQAKYPQNMLGKLAKIEANPAKSKHLETVTTKILGLEIDLVNLRKEIYDGESRNPQMDFGTPKEDAERRDATVNALFYNLNTTEVEDFTGQGLQDILRKVIKTPIDPYQTFKDDPLRVLRAIRFASRLGWRIDEGDEKAMSDHSIQDALKTKITRERVNVELTKMLKGTQRIASDVSDLNQNALDQNPYQALQLIDRLRLYRTIFTVFNEQTKHPTKIQDWEKSLKPQDWEKAYCQLQAFMLAEPNEGTDQDTASRPRSAINSILIRCPEDAFRAWLLCAFVPWARVTLPAPDVPQVKRPPPPAATAARESLALDNTNVDIIEKAVVFLDEIIQIKDAAIDEISITNPTLKRKEKSTGRSDQGMAIRRWGPPWRSYVMYAILTQITEASEDEYEKLLEGYARWLLNLKELDLLEAYELKPLVRGDKLSKALGLKSGPWTKKALDIVVAWQLANPDERNAEAAIAEVSGRKKELGIT
ncbi:MAG: hypothetical protein Q9170_004082 [Blastenia crenularia]